MCVRRRQRVAERDAPLPRTLREVARFLRLHHAHAVERADLRVRSGHVQAQRRSCHAGDSASKNAVCCATPCRARSTAVAALRWCACRSHWCRPCGRGCCVRLRGARCESTRWRAAQHQQPGQQPRIARRHCVAASTSSAPTQAWPAAAAGRLRQACTVHALLAVTQRAWSRSSPAAPRRSCVRELPLRVVRATAAPLPVRAVAAAAVMHMLNAAPCTRCGSLAAARLPRRAPAPACSLRCAVASASSAQWHRAGRAGGAAARAHRCLPAQCRPQADSACASQGAHSRQEAAARCGARSVTPTLSRKTRRTCRRRSGAPRRS